MSVESDLYADKLGGVKPFSKLNVFGILPFIFKMNNSKRSKFCILTLFFGKLLACIFVALSSSSSTDDSC